MRRLVLWLLIIVGSTPLAAFTCDYFKTGYDIVSKLDSSLKNLVEKTSFSFRITGSLPDSIYFWRPQLSEGQIIKVDSILLNGLPAISLLENISFGIEGDEICGADRTRPKDSLVFTVPANGRLKESCDNKIEFFYRIEFKGEMSFNQIPLPGAFAYYEYYPRLVHDIDSIHNLDQRTSTFEKYSLKINIPKTLHLMAENDPDTSFIFDKSIEYRFDSQTTQQIIWCAVGDSYFEEKTLDGIRLNIYRHPDTKPDEEVLRDISNSYHFYNQQFGIIPYKKINLIFARLPDALGGVTGNNFILLIRSSNMKFLYDYFANYFGIQYRSVTAHEVAHLWAGSMVNFRDAWLAEALATYWSIKYSDKYGKPNPLADIESGVYQMIYRSDNFLDHKAISDHDSQLDYYYWGPKVLNMLSYEVGEDGFQGICSDFFKQYRMQTAGLTEFRESCCKNQDSTLEEFFRCWIDSGYHQDYSISDVKFKKTKSGYENVIHLNHSGMAHSRVPLEIQYIGGFAETTLISPDDLTVKRNLSNPIKSVFIDPKQRILEDRRCNNARPYGFKLYSPSLNPLRNMANFYSYTVDDEPHYKVFFAPDFPRHSDRERWRLGAILYVQKGFSFNRASEDGIKIWMGYNTRSDAFEYSAFLGGTCKHSNTWTSSYNMTAKKDFGKNEISFDLACARLGDWTKSEFLRLRMGLNFRDYYIFDGRFSEIWPARKTSSIVSSIGFENEKILPGLRTTLSAEKGLRLFADNYAKYYRLSLEMKKNIGRFESRLFAGKSGGDAIQERFDLSNEGMFKSLPPFRYSSGRIMAFNGLINQPLMSATNFRLFGNLANFTDKHSVISEAGAGFRLGSADFGIIIDMSFFISDRAIDGLYWSARRLRVQILIMGNEPKMDFRIN